tara:strand:- start:541 stop:765 length:225 start_codon:yes stop_codon:yes gene_type:complete
MEWFIVAIVYMWGSEQPEWASMDKSFRTRELCQEYYLANMDVRDDVMKLYPNQRSHSLVCLDEQTIDQLRGIKV